MNQQAANHHVGTVEINATDHPYTAETITVDEIRHLGNIPADHKRLPKNNLPSCWPGQAHSAPAARGWRV